MDFITLILVFQFCVIIFLIIKYKQMAGKQAVSKRQETITELTVRFYWGYDTEVLTIDKHNVAIPLIGNIITMDYEVFAGQPYVETGKVCGYMLDHDEKTITVYIDGTPL